MFKLEQSLPAPLPSSSRIAGVASSLSHDGPLALSVPIELAKPQNAFNSLVKALSDVLGPSSGINSSDVDPNVLISLMNEYISDQEEWQKYAFGDRSRNYTRNLVDKGNGKSNLWVELYSLGFGMAGPC